MTTYKVLTFPDPFLKTVAKPVDQFDAELHEIAEKMTHTMYENSGIGLAAVQVGVDKRLFIMDVKYSKDDPDSDRNPTVVINPELIEKADEQIMEEGCLSVPEFRAEVKRWAKITLRYQDLSGESREIEAEGLHAVCIQHEMDHLDGILFIDHLPLLQRNMVKKKLKKQYAKA